MEKLSESEREQLARAICNTFAGCDVWGSTVFQDDWRNLADAAYAYIAPRVLERALEELNNCKIPVEQCGARGSERAAGFSAGFGAARQAIARLMPPPADAAVEAVEEVLRDVHWIQGGNPSSRVETMKRIVAAVRKADAEKGAGR